MRRADAAWTEWDAIAENRYLSAESAFLAGYTAGQAEIEYVRGQRDAWHREALRLAATVDAVLAIHHKHETSSHCVGCWEGGGEDGAVSWPCPTVRAITGDTP